MLFNPQGAAHHNAGFVLSAIAISACLIATPAEAQWLQWGGPNRDFTVETSGLADQWPEDGPPQLWKRTLGEGYSSIVVNAGVLYTMYRRSPKDEAEYTIALSAETGKTIWEHENHSPFTPGMNQFGPGPHSTPLVCGQRLYTVGTNAVLHCFDKKTGKVLWKRDLPGELGAPVPYYGYACSPIAYRNLIILPVDHWREDGGPWATRSDDPRAHLATAEQSLVAFDQTSGEVVWKNHDYPTDYSSPILINFRGQDQLVALMRREIIGVEPTSGRLLWHQTVRPVPDENIATPLWIGDGLLFCTAAYNSGSRVIRLRSEGGEIRSEQLWYSRKMRILHGNAIRIGDHVYGTSGDFGATLMVCFDIKTGARVWVRRGSRNATCVYADGKLITLDEDGQLSLLTVSPFGMTIHSTCKITERLSWTPPTLVGTTLYVRDRRHIVALDLGKPEAPGDQHVVRR